ncbi:MAG: signal recognition particle [candidate division Zixibacteria bacterium DG_27]|nr:MAG: signal recognition particle [candidate division Zixibacteria bacterium DG_27]
MFEELTDRLEIVFKKLRGHGKLTEKNIKEALKEVRRALLEADVNYKVAREFIDEIQVKAVGEEVLKSITPGQQVIKIVHDQLIELLGGKATPLNLSGSPPATLMLIGLQGSGKTTLAGKLARFCQGKGKRPLLVAADTYRPAAIEQLKILGESIEAPVYWEERDPVKICFNAVEKAREEFFEWVIIDTAGRLQIDEGLMQELTDIKSAISASETLLVADAMTGQEAVNVAVEFNDRVGIDGVALTKLDGDARGGAALSIRATVGKPIKVVGVGEKLEALEFFHPDRMASRILGLGDVVTLVEKAQQAVDLREAEKLEKKLRKEEFTLEDFYEQLQQLKKMGPLESLLEMLPGVGTKALRGLKVDDEAMVKIEAVINSMTTEERRHPHLIDGSRRRRIARGSGSSIQEVNGLLKQFFAMQKMIRTLTKGKLKGIPKGMLPF